MTISLAPGVTLTPGYLDRAAQDEMLAAVRARHRRRAALRAAHAALRQADVGAHDELRRARLGDRRGARLSLSGDASGNRQAVAADPGHHHARVARACRLSASARGMPGELLRAGRAHGPAPGQGRRGFRRPRRVAVARRHGPLSRRRIEAQRSDQLGAACLRRRRGARRRRPARLSWRRSHPARHLDAAARGRADQSHAAPGDASL